MKYEIEPEISPNPETSPKTKTSRASNPFSKRPLQNTTLTRPLSTTILTPSRNPAFFTVRERLELASRMSEETKTRKIEEEKEPLITREAVGARLRAIGKTLRNIPRPTILHLTILALVLALAGIVRLLPLRWGAYISEFDPYFNFNDMRQITANGCKPGIAT